MVINGPVNIYFLSFNNFRNRIIKYKASMEDYAPYIMRSIGPVVNFNPANGITTKYVLTNWGEGIAPDYVIVVDNYDGLSRWFVIDANYERNGQYVLSLYRDVVADNYREVLDSTGYIEKGYVSSANPYIFNSENVSFNQIKKAEQILKGPTQCPWLVAYLSRSKSDGTTETGNRYSGTFAHKFDGRFDLELDNISDYNYYSLSSTPYQYINRQDLQFGFYFKGNAGNTDSLFYVLTSSGTQLQEGRANDSRNLPTGVPTYPSTNYFQTVANSYSNSNYSEDNLVYNGYSDWGYEDQALSLLNENGKIIKTNDGYYSIKVVRELASSSSQLNRLDLASNTELALSIKANVLDKSSLAYSATPTFYVSSANIYRLSMQFTRLNETNQLYSYSFDYQVSEDDSTVNIVTADAPYEIIAAPYSDTIEFRHGDEIELTNNAELAKQWFESIATTSYAAGQCYDIQLLPYCPVDSTDLSSFDLISLNYKDTSIRAAFAIKLKNATFSQVIDGVLDEFPYRANNKLSVNCDIYRLVSPDGSSIYEFSPAKSGGRESIETFNIDCTLMPINPYIKVSPIFSNLYGADFNDYRGLICGSKFSLPIVTSQWLTYKYNNSNYQNIFDRQIESQEYQNRFSHINEAISAITGSLGAGVMLGSALASPIAGIGAGTASLVGGLADVAHNRAIRQENLDAQTDIFELNLGNIKARGNTLSRVTEFNANNKIFPYLEYYTCTDEEVASFQELLRYRGMNVGVIGTIRDYLSNETTYIKASLINIDIRDSSDIAEEINQILKGGIRIEYSS